MCFKFSQKEIFISRNFNVPNSSYTLHNMFYCNSRTFQSLFAQSAYLSLLEALLLGVIQGLTEFLPVSSSGHLELGKFLLGDNSIPRESMMFTVVLHFATAFSTLIVFRKEVTSILLGLFEFKNNEPFRFSLKILLSMVPAGFIGFFYSEELERLFDKQILPKLLRKALKFFSYF